MNNDIKKIIQSISDFYKMENALKYYLDRHKANTLLDYITNLQESEAYYYGQYEDHKQRNEKAINKIQHIIDYGFDYDGFNTVESLKGLIDMLVDYARQSKDILKGSDKDG